MGKNALLSIGLALFGAAAPFVAPAMAAPANSTSRAVPPDAKHADIVFNNVFIFFRNDDATLTPLMVKTVTRAAELAKQGGATRIKITGYSDDAKRPKTLGQERANAVKAVLVAQGIPEASIETQPREKAPPASNVGGPNPANHRARITLYRAFTAPVGPRDGAR
jgi:outer membrane protein OmpA-like peptidoglycan-associated protein